MSPTSRSPTIAAPTTAAPTRTGMSYHHTHTYKIINILMPVKLNSFTHLRALLVLHS
jgi:hypothetical protein